MKKNVLLTLCLLLLGLLFISNESKAQLKHYTYSSSLTAASPALPGFRIARLFSPSSCAVPKTCPGPWSTSNQYYDTFNFRNVSADSQCVTVTFQVVSGTQIFFTAYKGYFDPANVCTNYMGDYGASAVSGGGPLSFSFKAPPGTNFTMVGNGTNAAETVDFTLDVEGEEIYDVDSGCVILTPTVNRCVGTHGLFVVK